MSTTTSDHSDQTSLCRKIRRIAAAGWATEELNRALCDLAEVALPVLKPRIEAWLKDRRRRIGGPDGVLDEAEDILNRLLYYVARAARGFRGTVDAQAWAWLNLKSRHLVEDAVKTARGRCWNLLNRLREMGYDRWTWDSKADEREPEDETKNQPEDETT